MAVRRHLETGSSQGIPLAVPGEHFPLGPVSGIIASNHEKPSDDCVRPFMLRFAKEVPEEERTPVPTLNYNPILQMNFTKDGIKSSDLYHCGTKLVTSKIIGTENGDSKAASDTTADPGPSMTF